MSSVSEEEANTFMAEFEELVLDIDAFGIFTHNTTIALPMFIPGFGIAWGLFSAWSTGFAFAAIATTAPQLAEVPPLTILFLSPFGSNGTCSIFPWYFQKFYPNSCHK